jgi:hypothetical protein
MLQLLAVICAVVNTGAGLALAVTRGGILGQLGVPPPLPFYGDLLAIFLIASGLGFVPAILNPTHQRPYLWIFGVGLKLVAASLLARLWFSGLVGYAVGLVGLADAVLAGLMLAALVTQTSDSRLRTSG